MKLDYEEEKARILEKINSSDKTINISDIIKENIFGLELGKEDQTLRNDILIDLNEKFLIDYDPIKGTVKRL